MAHPTSTSTGLTARAGARRWLESERQPGFRPTPPCRSRPRPNAIACPGAVKPPALKCCPPHQGDGAAYTVLQRFAAIAIGLAILAMIMTPLIANTGRLIMTLAQTIIRKWIQPGMDKMIAEGTAAKNKEWRDWLNRRDAALSQGQPFHEPAPDETTPA